MSDIPDFPLPHTIDNCDGRMNIIGFRLTLEYELFVYGSCDKCGKSFAYTIRLTSLYKIVRNYRKFQAAERKPLVPPLAITSATFTENDYLEAHSFGVIIPPDEATA